MSKLYSITYPANIELPKDIYECKSQNQIILWLLAHNHKLVKSSETNFEEFYRVEVNDHE